jgi:hypothetical protein
LNNLTILVTVLCAVTLSACSRAGTQPPVLAQVAASPSPTPKTGPSPSPSPIQPIRSIDFANVSYPRYPVYTDERKKYIALKAGEGAPAYLNYGDVTGDGIEEAMAVLGIENRGSAIPEIVYIFGLEKGRLKLLWSFEAGDRADGGVRQAYADSGELIVELYGKDRVVGSNLYRGDEGLCCPRSFTRARYEWRGNRFQLKGRPEVLPNPAGHASSVMPYYSSPRE